MADASALAAMEYAIEHMTLAGPNHDLIPNGTSKRTQLGHISRYRVATESCHDDIKYNATRLHTIYKLNVASKVPLAGEISSHRAGQFMRDLRARSQTYTSSRHVLLPCFS